MAPSLKVDTLRRSAALPVAAELEALAQLDLGQLRVQYRNRTGRIAPGRISRPLLLRVLAHRIQVEAFGDLGRDTKRMLDRLAAATTEAQEGIPAPVQEAPRIKPGTVLSREWQGRMENVMALDEGFAWNGKAHTSLSAVAFAITGTKWNGRRFFGLRGRGKNRPPIDDRTRAASATDAVRCTRTSSERCASTQKPDRSSAGAQS